MSGAKSVFITGASRGIGRSAAFAFAKRGWNIYAAARNRDGALDAVKSELENTYPVKFVCFSGDVSEEDFVRTVFSRIRDEGGLDALVNNAGIDYMGLLQDMTLADWEKIFKVNVTAAFLTCREAIPLFLQKQEGAIVNVSSVWGNHGASFEAAYSASKGALNALTQALARELAPSRIRVNAAAFGAIDTDMNACLTPEDRKALEEEIPFGRFGTPEEAGELIFDLAAGHSYLTGQIITMDGGWL